MEHGAKSQLTRRAERTPRERHTYRTQTALGRLYYRATEDDSISGPREPQNQRASNGDASSASLVGPLGGADAGARLALESGKRTSGNMGRGFRREGAQDVPGERDAESVDGTYSRWSTVLVPVPSTLQCLRELPQNKFPVLGRGELLALALPNQQLPVHVLRMCSVPVQAIRLSTSVMRCSQPRQEVTSQQDGLCGWGYPSGSQ
ncbi:hypothetical protein GGI43DRAFT_98771 [Trichoderma evansii]